MLMHPTLFPVVSVVGLLSTCQSLNVSHAIGNTLFANSLLQKGHSAAIGDTLHLSIGNNFDTVQVL